MTGYVKTNQTNGVLVSKLESLMPLDDFDDYDDLRED